MILNIINLIGTKFTVSHEDGRDTINEVKGLLMSGAESIQLDFSNTAGFCTHFYGPIAVVLEENECVTVVNLDDYRLKKLQKLRDRVPRMATINGGRKEEE